jgi:hypothetical protein
MILIVDMILIVGTDMIALRAERAGGSGPSMIAPR